GRTALAVLSACAYLRALARTNARIRTASGPANLAGVLRTAITAHRRGRQFGGVGLHHSVAATDAECLPGDVAGAIGSQKGDGFGDILREAKAAEGIEPGNTGFQVRG